MSVTIDDLMQFYRSPLGRISRRLIADTMLPLAPVQGQRVLGIGYVTPYLSRLRPDAERVMAFMPQRQGVTHWPQDAPSLSALVDPLELPLTDSAVDVVIAIHALEHLFDLEEFMQELWRITAPGARVILVVPRRRGFWAQRDTTPFGHGHPFSQNQLARLLKDHSFTPEVWREALYLPPSNFAPLLKSARMFETLGRLLGSGLAGVMLVRARKEMYPAVTRRRRAPQFANIPGLVSQPAWPTGHLR